jgi:hypothetical protein
MLTYDRVSPFTRLGAKIEDNAGVMATYTICDREPESRPISPLATTVFDFANEAVVS